jgi:hypothetical protein
MGTPKYYVTAENIIALPRLQNPGMVRVRRVGSRPLLRGEGVRTSSVLINILPKIEFREGKKLSTTF